MSASNLALLTQCDKLRRQMTDIGTVRELLRRAILTLAALPDPDIRFRLGPRCAWPSIVQAARDAYGAAPPKLRTFQPTPTDQSRCLDVLAWLRWYELACGPETVRLFTAWAFGRPMWFLQERCTTNRRQPATPQTVRARLDGLVRTIANRLQEDALRQAIDEFTELELISPNPDQGSDCAESDLRTLPTSPKACISAVSEPPSAKDEARAHADLTKRFERNRLAAMRRQQRTKASIPALIAG